MPIARGTGLERTMNKMSITSVLVSLAAAMSLVLLFADQVSAQTMSTSPSTSVTGGSITSRSPGTWITQGIANEQNGSTSGSPGTTSAVTPNLFQSILEQLFALFATLLQSLFGGLTSMFPAAAGG
jgi:hypothetical protein